MFLGSGISQIRGEHSGSFDYAWDAQAFAFQRPYISVECCRSFESQ